MKLLKEIYQSDIGGKNEPGLKYELRKAARAVVFDNENNIALLHVKNDNYWKLPGGGIEEGEDIKLALEREVEEEVGVDIEIGNEVGMTIEYRDYWKQLQISYCYRVKVVGEKRKVAFTDFEKECGFELHWMPFNEAIEKVKQGTPKENFGKFIQIRDSVFLGEIRKTSKLR